MPQTAQQIVSDACLEAKCPAYLSIAGRRLNEILADLCSYDIDVTRQTYQFVFNPGVLDPLGVGSAGSGPYAIGNTNYTWLRANRDDVFYIIQGVKYVMIPVELAELDAMVAQGGLNAYPDFYAVDNSPIASGSQPNMYVWPPPAGSYPVTARYYAQMPDITTPETSSAIPWFPDQLYLRRRLAGELMLFTGDDRATTYLGDDKDGFMGAASILRRYLQTQGDSQTVKTVTLDRRKFGSAYSRLPNTKTIGW